MVFCFIVKENFVPDGENLSNPIELESFLMILNKEKVLIFFKKITILFNLIVKKIKQSPENTNFFQIEWEEVVDILKNSDNILKFDFI